MDQESLRRYAKLLVGYCLAVRAGERVAIRSTSIAEPLLSEIVREIYSCGAHPHLLLSVRDQERHLFACGDSPLLLYDDPVENLIYRDFDCLLTVRAPHDAFELSDVPMELRRRREESRKPLRDIFSERSASGALRWCICQYPAPSSAALSGMDTVAYADFIAGAVHLDREDPGDYWRELSARQERIARWLDERKTLRFVAEGTDLSCSVAGRRWINSDGRRNMPSGEIFTAPVEGSVEGHITFSFPGVYMDREVANIRLVFSGGAVSEAYAEKGIDVLEELLKIDGARVPGEIAIGTNYGITHFSRNILFDEKIGGTMHLALGDSYGECGGTNRSVVHWDLIADMRRPGSRIEADGEVFYADGRFLESFLNTLELNGGI